MRFHLGKITIHISFFFCLLLCLMLLFGNRIIALAFGMVCAHESAHLFVMRFCSVPVREVNLEPFGIIIKKESIIMDFKQKMCIILAGCALNLLLAAGFFLLWLGIGDALLFELFGINLSIAVLNALPVIGLDGGQVLFEIIKRKKGEEFALNTTKTVSIITCLILLAAGMIICIKVRFNPSLCLLSLFLLMQTFIGQPNYN